ncbi:MAG: DUF932 domain-containing protein [Ginsengibacter sp.]
MRHTENTKGRLEEAHKAMGISNELSDNRKQFSNIGKVSITSSEFKKLIQQAMPPVKEVLHNLQLENYENYLPALKYL